MRKLMQWCGGVALAAGLGLAAQPAQADRMFAWTTEDGVYSYTDDFKKVPARYKEQVTIVDRKSLDDYKRFTPKDAAATGRYEARLEVAEQQIGQYRFQVEEFVPERMKVEVGTAEPEYLFGEAMAVTVASRYLFGGVPAGHRVEVSCEIAPGSFSPRQNAEYHYGVWRPESSPPSRR